MRLLAAALVLLVLAGCRSAPEVAARSDVLRGRFSCRADAAVFEQCTDRQCYPVAMEAGYLGLDRPLREPHLILRTSDARAVGATGCNSFGGA